MIEEKIGKYLNEDYDDLQEDDPGQMMFDKLDDAFGRLEKELKRINSSNGRNAIPETLVLIADAFDDIDQERVGAMVRRINDKWGR